MVIGLLILIAAILLIGADGVLALLMLAIYGVLWLLKWAFIIAIPVAIVYLLG